MSNKLANVVRKSKGGSKQKPVPVKIVSDAPDRVAPYDDMKYRARDALSTLQRAEEIRRDKPLLKAAKAEAKQQMKQLSKVCT